jgi:predicted small secreted protein
MKKLWVYALGCLLLASCNPNEKQPETIIEK